MTRTTPVLGSVRIAGRLAEIPVRAGMPERRHFAASLPASALVAGSCAMKRYPLYSVEAMKSRREAVLSHG